MKSATIAVSCATAFCLCNTASAQSTTSVTLYGLVDAALDISSQGAGRLSRLESGGTFGSRWGLRGAEDLGGGLKAIFQLESGFGVDTGTLQQGGRAFGRHSWVGLQSPWGTLTVGRQLSPHFHAFSNIDAFQLGNAGGLSVVTRTNAAGTPGFLLGSYLRTGRIDNSFNYSTPDIGGFSARLMYGLSESPSGQSAGGSAGASVRYVSGPLDLNAGYMRAKDTDGYGDFKVWSAGGSYALGNTKLFVGYTADRNTSGNTATARPPKADYRLTNVGARYQITPLTTIIGQVIRVADRSDNRPGNRDATVFAIGFNHDWSKRTALYGSVGTVNNQNGSAYSLGGALYPGGPVVGNARAKTIALGMRHIF